MSRAVPREDIDRILEAAQLAPTPHNMQNFEIVVIDEPEILTRLGAVRADASEEFLKESYKQLSFSDAELEAKGTGLLANNFPPAWTNPEAWDPSSDYRSQVAFVNTWMRFAPLLLLLFRDKRKRAPASQGDVLGSIGIGCVLENMWLAAVASRLSFQVLTAVTSPAVESSLKRLLSLPDWAQVDVCCRVGYSKQPPTAPSVRRPVRTFTHHNRYGEPYVDAGSAVSGSDRSAEKALT